MSKELVGPAPLALQFDLDHQVPRHLLEDPLILGRKRSRFEVDKWYERLVRRIGRSPAALTSTVIVTLVILGPGLAVLSAFVREARAALEGLDRDVLVEQFRLGEGEWERVRFYIPGAQALDLATLVNQASANVAGFSAPGLADCWRTSPSSSFHLFVTLFALFFLLRDAGAIMRGIRRALPFDEPRRERMIRQTGDLVYASVTSGLIIASIQGLLGGFSSRRSASTRRSSGVWSWASSRCCRFFGTWVVWLPAAIWLASAPGI